MKIVSPEQFDFPAFKKLKCQKRFAGNPGTTSKTRYKDVISAFDIETTGLPDIEQSIMYVWQWAFDDVCVVGRTWEQFLNFAENLMELMKPNEVLVVFVHNLAYEFQFLRGIWDFGEKDVFCTEARRILYAKMGTIEFRCSYMHSNMSLKEYTEKMGAEHSKLSGEEFDYSKIRYPWTPLTDQELAYCVHDVIGLVEAIKIEMQHDRDNLYTFPLTSTGYVRRDGKRAMHRVPHTWITKQVPTWHVYEMCREAFRGGNTHSNRHFTGRVLRGTNKVAGVKSVDRSSSYPDVLVNKPYPADAFYEVGPCSLEKFYCLYRKMERACLFRARFTGIKLKDYTWGCPYIPRDRCRNIVAGAFDNGRVLEAESLEITITDVDMRIFEYEYEWDSLEILDLCYTRYAMLPHAFTRLVNMYYERKTSLKGIDGAELDYYRAKAKLNSLYGMTAQDPVKQSIIFKDNEYRLKDEDPQKLLAENNRRRQLPNYQVGCWVTAWARYMLELAIIKVHETPGAFFCYTDTDSVKYMGEVDFSEYNAKCIEDSTKNGAYAVDSKGNTHYMGVLEEDERCRAFVTLGAKKYAYEDLNGKLHITVAGVIKKAGALEMEKKGGIEAFKPDFVFTEAGGLEAVYNDTEYGTIEIDGHSLKITANVYLKPSTYTLGITNEYEYLLSVSGIPVDVF